MRIFDAGGVQGLDLGGLHVKVQAGVAFALSTLRPELINVCIRDVEQGKFPAAAPSYISLLQVLQWVMQNHEKLNQDHTDARNTLVTYRRRLKQIRSSVETVLDDLDTLEEDDWAQRDT